jgi:hypothetical protein
MRPVDSIAAFLPPEAKGGCPIGVPSASHGVTRGPRGRILGLSRKSADVKTAWWDGRRADQRAPEQLGTGAGCANNRPLTDGARRCRHGYGGRHRPFPARPTLPPRETYTRASWDKSLEPLERDRSANCMHRRVVPSRASARTDPPVDALEMPVFQCPSARPKLIARPAGKPDCIRVL